MDSVPWGNTDNESIYTARTLMDDNMDGEDDGVSTRRSVISRRSSVTILCTLSPATSSPQHNHTCTSDAAKEKASHDTKKQSLPEDDFSTQYWTQYYIERFYERLKLAEKGDPQSQFEVGNYFHHEIGTHKDDHQALLWYHRAAEQGNVDGQYMLGIMYYCGCGTESDSQQAVEWFRRAAEQGHARSVYTLGSSYIFGQGVERDLDLGISLYLKAAEDGDPYAQSSLGDMYATGWLVEKDIEKAIYWFRRAAEQDFPTCQERLKELLATKKKKKFMLWGLRRVRFK